MSTHPWKKNYRAGDDFTKIDANMPRETREWLEEMSVAMKMPPWKLICIALDNERDLAQPFQYEWEEPKTVFVEHAYNAEAHKIYRFLKKFPNGLGRDAIQMFRRQIGIPNRMDLALGLRELLTLGMAYESEDFRKRHFITYPDGYKHVFAANTPTAAPRTIESEKNRLDALKRKLERQEKKVKRMEGSIDFKKENDDGK